MTRGRQIVSLLICSFTLLTGCGETQVPGQVPQGDLLTGTDSMRDFGDYVVYVNALTTERLTAEVAREYGVVRSPQRALLTLSVHKKQDSGPTVAVTGELSATATNLNGQLNSVQLREIREAEAVYYIGEQEVSDQETLTYAVSFVPDGDTDPINFRFQRQFFVED